MQLPFRVAALDQIDGIERAVDCVMPPEEEAGKRHHLAATMGRERRFWHQVLRFADFDQAMDTD